MKEQIIITGHDRTAWENRVNNLLKDGEWIVVPHTISISSSTISNYANNVFVVVLEKQKE